MKKIKKEEKEKTKNETNGQRDDVLTAYENKNENNNNSQSESIIDKIAFIVILVTIVLLSIFVGSNIKEPIWLIQTIISIFTAIYLIIKLIQKQKNIIIKSKVDIAVILFMVSTIIPLALQKQVSLEGSVNFILKYWSVFGLYILTKNTVNNSKRIKIIINTVVATSIIPIIFGYDKLFGSNIFLPFLDFINAVKIDDTRMISNFGYANTFAAYLALTTSLAIAQYLNNNKKIIKALYAIYIVIAAATIILTQSKFVLALIALIILIFIILGIKNKKIPKKWIIIGAVLIVIFLVYVFIASKISKPLQIVSTNKTCVIRGIESNTNYEFNFNIDAKTQKTYNVFTIKIVEITRYFSEKTIGKLEFANFNGNKIINVKTNEEIDHIEIRIENELEQELTINNLDINGRKYILEYKIIPEPVLRVFTTFNFKNSSVWQRGDYYKDALKILKDNWIFGAGGNTWRMLYGLEQSYLYYAKEAHCYILEIWMSFGVLGLTSYLVIVLLTAQQAIRLLKAKKQNKNEYRNMLAIVLGLTIITIHSLVDFDMSYLIMEMTFYMFISIINNQNENVIKTKGTITNIIITCAFIAVAVCNTLGLVANIYSNQEGTTSNKIAPWVSKNAYNKIVYIENNNISDSNKIKYIKTYIKNEPYQYQNTMYEIMCDQIVKDINSQNLDEQIENISYLIDTWKNIKNERKYDIVRTQKRAEIMYDFAKNLYEKEKKIESKELENKVANILEIIIREYPENAKIILDYKRNREIESITKFKYGYYTDVYKKAVTLLENIPVN